MMGAVRTLVTLLALTALGTAGLLSGTALVSDPTGTTLGLDVDMLPSWHSWDYRLPGAFVLLALGIAPLLCTAALLLNVPGAGFGARMIGVVTIAWVLFQIVVLDIEAPRAQTALGLVGIVLILGTTTATPRRPQC